MTMKSERTIWGIHAGKTGDAESLFQKQGVIAIGWHEMGDLSSIPADREAFKTKMVEVVPNRKPGYYPVAAGQVYRFVHEMKIHDLVIFPTKHDRRVLIGEVLGTYKYDPDKDPGYPQQRAVKWLESFPRSKFSQGALYEIGSAMCFFQVKNYADEFLAALAGQKDVASPKQDESVSYVVDGIEQTTRDFVLKSLAQDLKGHALADFVAQLLGAMGYQTRLSLEGPDGGVDIIAHKDVLGFEPPIIKVQVKSSEGSIGDPVVSQLYGKVERSEHGLVVTLGTFTHQARAFARNKSNLRLIDGEELVSLVLQYYEQFGPKYKGMLPLRRVYVPEPLGEAAE